MAVLALDIVLADQFLVGPPLRDCQLRIGQNFVPALAGRALEQHIFDDHGVPPGWRAFILAPSAGCRHSGLRPSAGPGMTCLMVPGSARTPPVRAFLPGPKRALMILREPICAIGPGAGKASPAAALILGGLLLICP